LLRRFTLDTPLRYHIAVIDIISYYAATAPHAMPPPRRQDDDDDAAHARLPRRRHATPLLLFSLLLDAPFLLLFFSPLHAMLMSPR